MLDILHISNFYKKTSAVWRKVEIKLKCYGSSHHIDENAIVTNHWLQTMPCKFMILKDNNTWICKTRFKYLMHINCTFVISLLTFNNICWSIMFIPGLSQRSLTSFNADGVLVSFFFFQNSAVLELSIIALY
jgi:hypothetical protein